MATKKLSLLERMKRKIKSQKTSVKDKLKSAVYAVKEGGESSRPLTSISKLYKRKKKKLRKEAADTRSVIQKQRDKKKADERKRKADEEWTKSQKGYMGKGGMKVRKTSYRDGGTLHQHD